MFHFFTFNKSVYVAIIGDIVQSKKIQDRNQSQKNLKSILDDINLCYSDDIASKFMITIGDEFQGLLKYGKNTIEIIRKIEIKMHPVEIRFGVGIGEITTDINREMPLGTDGPAYYNARKSIENLKNVEKKNRMLESNIMITSADDNPPVDLLINSILSLCTTIKSKWTDRQREIAIDSILNGDNQVKAAERLGIKQSSVQKGLSNAGYYSYKSAMETVSKALSEIMVVEHV